MKILEVELASQVDEIADTSYLGEFSNSEDTRYPDSITIDHSDGGRKFRYFHAHNVSNQDEADQNYRRILDHGNGWWAIGVYAKAVIEIADVRQELSSGGLYGIESDSGESYFREVASDELGALRDICEEVGLDLAEFDKLAAEALENMDI